MNVIGTHGLTQRSLFLENISPTEAMKTRNGRQMVKALLDDFENIEKHGAPGQSQQKYIDWARQQLGLV